MHTKNHGDLVPHKNFLTEARVCRLIGVQSCLVKISSMPYGWELHPPCVGLDKHQEQTRARVWSRCFVSPTISYLLLQSKAVIVAH
jgi:hypothetical protein